MRFHIVNSIDFPLNVWCELLSGLVSQSLDYGCKLLA
jgi:hypothetical protein